MNGQQLGAQLTQDGFNLQVDEDDLVEGVVVIAKIRDMRDGLVTVSIAATSDVDAITQLGMITGAVNLVGQYWRRADGGDDE